MARHEQVARRFKSAAKANGVARCEVCRWAPPRGLAEAGAISVHKIMHAHHIVPLACGGPDEPDNLVLLCPNCHALAHRLGKMIETGSYPEYRWEGPLTRDAMLADLRMVENDPDAWSERMRREAETAVIAERKARAESEQPEAERRRLLMRALDGGCPF